MDHGDALGVRGGVAGVLVGQLGIGVEQSLQHDEVTGDVLGVGASEGAQLTPGGGLEVLRNHVLRHTGLRHLIMTEGCNSITPSVFR